jgi:hypothetical protein
MLEFFRKYQRYFFMVITIVIISSFTFFGTYSTLGGAEERPDPIIGQMIDGSKMRLSDVQKLSRFIATDRENSLEKRGEIPNLCNDGVVRYDLIKEGLADLVAKEYFDSLKSDLQVRLDRVKRYKPYAHPQDPTLSAKEIWDHFVPELNQEIQTLQGQNEVDLSTFTRLKELYQMQSRLHPEMLRQILIYQHRQKPSLKPDERLAYDDLALFGFHSPTDWFGRHFIELCAEFILNTAASAEQKGYEVSLEEAKGDLIHTFQESLDQLTRAKKKPEMNLQSHLQMLGFDLTAASEVWRKVLLFRRYFKDVGESTFVDRLAHKDFSDYAKEMAKIELYKWPIVIQTPQDFAQFQFYVKAISKKVGKEGLPQVLLSVEEVEKKHPQLVQTTYRAKVAEVSKKQVGLIASLKEVWNWQTEDANWALLKEEFLLPNATKTEERFKILEKLDPNKRSKVDAWSRAKMVDQNPHWVQQALDSAPFGEKIWSVAGNEEPLSKSRYRKVENLEKIQEKHILVFAEAREILSKLTPKTEPNYDSQKNPFLAASREALAALQKSREDERWVQTGTEPLMDQFKLEKKEVLLARNSKEDWMKEKAFLMLPEFWSPIHVADQGEIAFFYLQEKKSQPAPILDPLTFGLSKEVLAADAKAYAAEKLLQVVKKKNAIVIPIQKEDE